MNSEKVKLIECFRTWQGEGPDSGESMLLCRFKFCNKSCKYCDTLIKMRISRETDYLLKDLQTDITENRLGLMITGGEPTINKHFDETVLMLKTLNYGIANVESNGYNLELLNSSLEDVNKNIKLIYSPKIFSKSDLEEEIERTKKLFSLDRVFIKVVYQENELIDSYLQFLNISLGTYKPSKVWLMPEGVTRNDLIVRSEKVFDICEKYKFNFSSRNHIIYGFI